MLLHRFSVLILLLLLSQEGFSYHKTAMDTLTCWHIYKNKEAWKKYNVYSEDDTLTLTSKDLKSFRCLRIGYYTSCVWCRGENTSIVIRNENKETIATFLSENKHFCTYKISRATLKKLLASHEGERLYFYFKTEYPARGRIRKVDHFLFGLVLKQVQE